MTLDNLLPNALKQLKSQVFTQSYTSTFHLLSIDLLIANGYSFFSAFAASSALSSSMRRLASSSLIG